MTMRSLFAGMAVVTLSGCALIAGYDFGKYTEGGSGGAGGHGVARGPSSASVSTTGATGGAPSASSSSTSPTTVSVTASTASSSGDAMSASASGTSSSSTTASTASGWSSSSAASSSSGVTVVAAGLLGPQELVVDTGLVYFTTNIMGPANSVQEVAKSGGAPTIEISGNAAPAIALGGTGSGARAAVTTVSNTGELYDVSQSSVLYTTLVQGVTILGVATVAGSVFFTTSDGQLWLYTASAKAIIPTANAAGPIAADKWGIYWSTKANELMRADTTTYHPQTLASTSMNAINAITTDTTSFVYWTDQGGNVFQVPNGYDDAGAVTLLNVGAGPAYGIAVPLGGGDVYFTRGSDVFKIEAVTHITSSYRTGLNNPRGIAIDGAGTGFVAEYGNPPQANGAIVSFAAP